MSTSSPPSSQEPEPPVEKKAVLHLMLDTDEMDYYQTITVGDGAKSRGVEDDTHSLRYIRQGIYRRRGTTLPDRAP